MRNLLYAATALGLAALATPASANVITPGGTGVAPDVFGTAPGTLVISTGTQTLNSSTFSANYTETIYRATSLANGSCAGCLNFVVQLNDLAHPPPGDGEVDIITAFNFAGFTTDAGYNTTLGGGGTDAPTDVERGAAGDNIDFTGDTATGLDLVPGATTVVLVD